MNAHAEGCKDSDPLEDELNNVDISAAVNMKKRTFTEMCREACGLLRAVNKKLDARDEFQIFGEHVAMKLRSLKSEIAKNVAQFRINTVLFEAVSGKYDSEASIKQEEKSPSTDTSSLYTSDKSSVIPPQQLKPPINVPSLVDPQYKSADSTFVSLPATASSQSSTSTYDFDQLCKMYDLTYDDLL